MRQPSRKLLTSLCSAAQPLLPSFNNQDMSTSVWALGTLGHNPGPLMQGIALHAAASVADFQPKACSSPVLAAVGVCLIYVEVGKPWSSCHKAWCMSMPALA